MDTKSKLVNEIRETNLAYLILAQALIREDRPSALLQLGLSEDVAQIVETFSPAQISRLSQNNLLLCRMRFTDDLVWNLLSDRKAYRPAQSNAQNKEPSSEIERGANRLHASILMAGQFEDAL
jgi:flagellar transcriptional activator FlhD